MYIRISHFNIILSSLFLSLNTYSPLLAQNSIKADSTFGASSSNIDFNNNMYEITGGYRRGDNLFHSFIDFSLPKNNVAHFKNTQEINNVFSRVTGNNRSNIDGLIKFNSKSTANLFLINPNGIIFGPNTRLAIGGSLLASTASSILFPDGKRFSSTDKVDNQSILSIKVPIGLQFSSNPSPISIFSKNGLNVNQDKSLVIAGGDIKINDGVLNAPSGNVSILGISGTKQIDLSILGDDFNVLLKEDISLSNVSLINNSKIDVSGKPGGRVQLFGKNINISNSEINNRNLGTPDSPLFQSGDIYLIADNSISILNSNILNNLELNSFGNAGNIRVVSKDFNVIDSSVRTRTFGQGNAGSIIFNIDNSLLLKGATSIGSNIDDLKAVGTSGGVEITARNLTLADGGQITARNGGNSSVGPIINIDIQEKLIIDGQDSFGFNSAIFGEVSKGAIGNGANVNIETSTLQLSNSGQINTSTFGKGNAGNITIKSLNGITLDSSKANKETAIFSLVEEGAEGNSGFIEINTPFLSLSDGAQIGNSFRDDSEGKSSGDININALGGQVLLTGSGPNGRSSGFFAATEARATGDAGNITVQTGKLNISDGAIINSQTLNKSDGGNITITARDFEASNGGQIITTADNAGNSGNIKLNISNNILVSGSDTNFKDRKEKFGVSVQNEGPASGIFASTSLGSSGNAGNIIIDPRLVVIEDDARISVDTNGTGVGGNIEIIADRLFLDKGSITATTTRNQGGDILLTLNDFLFMRGQSVISASAGQPEQTNTNQKITGGNITISANNIVAEPNSNSDIFATSFGGRGGAINITARKNLFGFEETSNLNPQDNTINDVTAQSSVNPDLNGQVNITTGEVDPSDNLAEQPETVDTPQEIAKGCRPGQSLGGSSFVNVGRGGLPQGPQEAQTPPSLWQDLRAHNLQPSKTAAPTPTSLAPPPEIVEAKGWAKDTQGRIYLTASAPQPSPNPLQPTPTC